MKKSIENAGDIEMEISDLYSASDDYKACAEIVKSVSDWSALPEQDIIGVLNFFADDTGLTTAQKKSLLKLMFRNGMNIFSSKYFYIFSANYSLLKFSLSEFSFPSDWNEGLEDWNTLYKYNENEDVLSTISFLFSYDLVTTAQKKSLLKLMYSKGMNIFSPVCFYVFCQNNAVLKFVLSEFSFPNELVDRVILHYAQATYSNIPLKSLKICLEYGYKLSRKTVFFLLSGAAACYDADKVLFLLDKFHLDINLYLEREDNMSNRESIWGEQKLSLLAYASDWRAYGALIYKDARAKYRYQKLAKRLLALGADINFTPAGSETTALMCAANINIFNFLLKHGADLYAVTPTLKTNILQQQAENFVSGLAIVKELVEKYHFDIHYCDASGKMALNYAIVAKNYDVIHYLCKHGALEDVEDIEKFVKNTVTNVYSEREKLFVTHLMKYGFDKDGSGRHLLDYCDKAEIDPEWLNICIEEESGLDDEFPLTEFSESQISEIEKIIARKVKK